MVCKKSFSGMTAVKTFMQSMGVDFAEALSLGSHLVASSVILHVGSLQRFRASDTDVYRLQCHATPDILNSYRVWTEKSNTCAMDLVTRLDRMMRTIELTAVDKRGKVDYTVAFLDAAYLHFEDDICEFQKVDLTRLNEQETLAFGINVYKLMLRYAFIKVGICVTEAERLHFCGHVKFNIGGHLYTFDEWVDGVLRGNRRGPNISRIPFSRLDKRRKFANSKMDYRVHFALNLGAEVGSTVSLPFSQYTAKGLDYELETAGRIFCAQEESIAINDNGTVRLSSVFSRYRSDFAKTDEAFFRIISDYLPQTVMLSIAKVLRSPRSIKYLNADWTKNAYNFACYDKSVTEPNYKGIKALVRRFRPPGPSKNERTRLATLYSLNILDTLPEERFDRITMMVKIEFNVPLVFVSLVDLNRQWFKSKQWGCPLPAADETGRDVSFCGHAINMGDSDMLYVENALEDDRFAENPLVTGDLNIRFYCGCNLTVPSSTGGDPVNIGTLCIIDQKPRQLTPEQKVKLLSYAAKVKREILRRDSNSFQEARIESGSALSLSVC
jgi:GAF domain-containing protein